MTNQELMEAAAKAAYDACLSQSVEPENAFHEALNAARNVSEKFSRVYGENLGEHDCGDVCNECHDKAWDAANEAAWENIFDAAHLAVVARGFDIAENEGLLEEEQINERVDAYVDSVLG